MLHEAVGHGLEGDFNRKKTSAVAGLLGERIAAPGLTVVDDGTMPDRRGSITADDEATPSNRTVLIEDGRLVRFLQERMTARLMGQRPAGHRPRNPRANHTIPTLSKTPMPPGQHDQERLHPSG